MIRTNWFTRLLPAVCAVLAMLWPDASMADGATLNGANTAWVLPSTALVMSMTLPGLALFYAGLATITPASGFVGPAGGVALGLAGGLACYKAVECVKHHMKIDDSLDVFAVHGVGGILGTLLAAIFASAVLGGIGLAEGRGVFHQFGVQLAGVVATVVWSAVASIVIIKVTAAACGGLRVTGDEETEGLDYTSHGESGYSL